MCGLFYIESFHGADIESAKIIEVTVSIMERGPDKTIIRLSNDKKRCLLTTILPICNGHKRDRKINYPDMETDALGYNGEIYAFPNDPLSVPADKTDTYTVLRLCREQRFEELYRADVNGFFASIYVEKLDDPSADIIFQTDIFGEKTLFYYLSKDIFIVSSTSKAISEYLRKSGIATAIDPIAVLAYLGTRNMLVRPCCFIEEIKRVPPGQVFRLDRKSKTIKTDSPTPIERIDRLYATLETHSESKAYTNAIQESFAGVPHELCGAVISGGVDSSIIAAELLQHDEYKDIPLFTINFKDRDPTSTNAKNLARLLGSSRHVEIDVDTAIYAEHLKRVYKAINSPLPTHSFASYSLLADEAAKRGVRVLYGGDGGDEIANGYAAYENVQDRYSEYSISPYSSFEIPEIPSIKSAIMESYSAIMSNFSIKSLIPYFEQHGFPREKTGFAASKWLDIMMNLYATGLLASDQIGSSYAIESRSPLVAPVYISEKLFEMDYRNADGGMKMKPFLKERFIHFYGKDNLMEKQGFSGYPNEAADLLLGNQKRYERLEEFLAARLPGRKDKDVSRRMEWKLQNLELFMRNN